MNKLGTEERTRVVACLVEGNSIRATSRMTGIARNTVNKLLVDLGTAYLAFQEKTLVNLPCKKIQCDEIWSFVGAKEKNASDEKKAQGWGDLWTWVAMDLDTKLIPCWAVGERDASAAYHFIHDLASRLANRVQLTTDGHRAYLSAVEDAFGAEVDYAMLVKLYGPGQEGGTVRYSPAECIGARKETTTGKPDVKHVSTSHIGRPNLTMRMSMRRFTRLTNGFGKKVENHEHSLAIHYMYYNFARIHQSIRVTPAMEAGVSDHVWTLAEIIALLN